ncbi:hypothetical protein HHB90_10965 [Neisseria meningitidis]|nr:hypothetical protein [Neisseria meningitidis]
MKVSAFLLFALVGVAVANPLASLLSIAEEVIEDLGLNATVLETKWAEIVAEGTARHEAAVSAAKARLDALGDEVLEKYEALVTKATADLTKVEEIVAELVPTSMKEEVLNVTETIMDVLSAVATKGEEDLTTANEEWQALVAAAAEKINAQEAVVAEALDTLGDKVIAAAASLISSD